jgi:hypothetical protein
VREAQMEDNMDWKTYEEVTKNIYETLGKHSGVSIINHGKNCKIEGKSGVKHQIDVLTSHSDGIHTYLTDIECKYWDQKINKDIVMKVDSIVKDCNFNKGVIISKQGFTSDAKKYAKSVGVGLVILREPTGKDWKGRTKTIIIKINSYAPHITKFENIATEVYDDISGKMVCTYDYVYVFNDGTKKTIKYFIEEFQKKLLESNPKDEITDEIRFDESVVLQDKFGNKISRIIGIKISGKIDITTTENTINGEDCIWLMMKSIFEGKTYVVSKEGEIRDVT